MPERAAGRKRPVRVVVLAAIGLALVDLVYNLVASATQSSFVAGQIFGGVSGVILILVLALVTVAFILAALNKSAVSAVDPGSLPANTALANTALAGTPVVAGEGADVAAAAASPPFDHQPVVPPDQARGVAWMRAADLAEQSK